MGRCDCSVSHKSFNLHKFQEFFHFCVVMTLIVIIFLFGHDNFYFFSYNICDSLVKSFSFSNSIYINQTLISYLFYVKTTLNLLILEYCYFSKIFCILQFFTAWDCFCVDLCGDNCNDFKAVDYFYMSKVKQNT